ncbi:MAG TPA: trypsin-like serine protease, partial [Kofleriaceae bacterium]
MPLVVGCTIEDVSTAQVDQEVIGGAAAPAGKWPDTVAVMWDGSQGCTGTLVAPNVVVTAGHCVAGGAPNGVLIGASALSKAQEGETIRVMRAIEYPNSWNTIDAGILILETPATKATPRPIATGWARFDVKNGAQVQLVGFGTIDRDGNVSTDSLMEATTTITDYNCTTSAGCNTAAQPDGELGAGGMGIDTCPGDSGGPAYLMTEFGIFLIGITSRGYDDNNYACSEGGIYERADKIVDWMEQQASVPIARAPSPTVAPIMTTRGDAGETKIEHNDPKTGATHTFAITKPPGFGKAAVRDDGTVRVCADKGVAGDDALEVTVSDGADPTRAIVVKVPIVIADATPPDSCDEKNFGGEGGGCCDTRRGAGGSIPLALFVLLVLRR